MPEAKQLVQQTYQDSTKKMGSLLNNMHIKCTHIDHQAYLYLQETEVFLDSGASCHFVKRFDLFVLCIELCHINNQDHELQEAWQGSKFNLIFFNSLRDWSYACKPILSIDIHSIRSAYTLLCMIFYKILMHLAL